MCLYVFFCCYFYTIQIGQQHSGLLFFGRIVETALLEILWGRKRASLNTAVTSGWQLVSYFLKSYGVGNVLDNISKYRSYINWCHPFRKYTYTHRPSTVTLAAHARRGLTSLEVM